MRVLALITAVVASTALIAGAAVVLVLAGPEADGWLIVASIAVSFLVIAPVLLASLYAYWGDPQSVDARRVLRGWTIGAVGVQLAAAITMFVWAGGAGGPLWIPVAFVTVAAVLTVAAVVVGRALSIGETRRVENSPLATPPLFVIAPEEVRRKALIVALTFVVALVVFGTGAVALSQVFGGGFVPAAAFSTFQISSLAASFAAIITTMSWNRAMRDVAGRDLGRARLIGKVVLRGKDTDLSPEDAAAAARYASIATVALRFQLAAFALLYLGLALGQVPRLFDDPPGWFSPLLLGVLVLALVVLLPWMVLQIHRATRYARQHPVTAYEHADRIGVDQPAPGGA